MNTNSFFNPQEALEQGQSILKKQAQTTVQSVTTQVTGQGAAPADGAKSVGAGQDKMTQDFLQDLYAPSDTRQTTQSGDEQTKLVEARKKLEEHKKQHMDSYYIPTFEQRKQQDERPAEKVEREEAEEKQKRWELQQEEAKKAPPIALQMATNKAEMFRGAAG
jgi:hypothetical protein